LFRSLYASGALGLYHRLRNADSLTVVMFHRTLRPGDPRWATCDPDYTLDESLFVESLAFFARHYHVVSLDQVLRARRDGMQLPPRALLISFDDGWLDNVDYALPALQRSGLPPPMRWARASPSGRNARSPRGVRVGSLSMHWPARWSRMAANVRRATASVACAS
jgi:peptidoglycan/xylan/chitin deacetylase (PgdA/CDA1 family)